MADEEFADWIGRFTESSDIAAKAPIARLAATLDHDGAHWPQGVVPPLGHWLFHLPDARQSALGNDGHPMRGGFLPPIPQQRRMWAGGRLNFHAPIHFGASLLKQTTLSRVERKHDLIFLTLTHKILADGELAVEEEQDLVYLDIRPPASPRDVQVPAADTLVHRRADEPLLFRFSALTFNAHRIHYDLAYTQAVELYPALVVHGPLQALLLMDHSLRDGVRPQRFAFRAHSPLYAPDDFLTSRSGTRLWVSTSSGTVTMTAEL